MAQADVQSSEVVPAEDRSDFMQAGPIHLAAVSSDRDFPQPTIFQDAVKDYVEFMRAGGEIIVDISMKDMLAEIRRLWISLDDIAKATGLPTAEVFHQLTERVPPTPEFLRAVRRLIQFRVIQAGAWVHVTSDYHVGEIALLMARRFEVPFAGELGRVSDEQWLEKLGSYAVGRSRSVANDCHVFMGYRGIDELASLFRWPNGGSAEPYPRDLETLRKYIPLPSQVKAPGRRPKRGKR